MKPLIAIIGRPNVGKSTLFNRIVGHRKALTMDEPGVTRDRLYAHADWNGREFICIDTGGFPIGEGTIDEKVEAQIELALAECDAIICVFDGQSGPLPEEQEIVARLRTLNKPVYYAVNKVDVPGQESRINDFYRYGVETLWPVSGEHGYQVAELLDQLVANLPSTEEEERASETLIQIAVVGRPNVGKSSLVNAVFGEEKVVVDKTAGTTRDVTDTSFHVGDHHYRFLDTAGIRRRASQGERLERLTVVRSLKAIDRADVCILVLAADEGVLKQDAHIARYIQEAGKGLLILWNKMDTVHWQDVAGYEERTRQALTFLPQVPVHFTSAQTGQGIDSVLEIVQDIHQALEARVPTSKLNQAFTELVEAHHIPMHHGRQVKLYYATQITVRPPTFIVFSNAPQAIPDTYKRYLLKGLAQKLSMTRVPIRVVFRRRR